ncbi:MAG: hypothetical protein QOD70_1222 [Frankiales bacterium]|nr:hypothetical protein [Frankiales bacterium]
MNPRRELWTAVLLCLLGSGLVLLGVTRGWATAPESSLTIKRVSTPLPGTLVAADVRALGFVGLAAVVAIAATKSWGRLVVGVLAAIAGVATVVLVARLLHDDLGARLATAHAQCQGQCVLSGQQAHPALHLVWPWATLLGGLVMAGGGLLVTARGRRWAALSSSYQVPAARETELPATDKGAWDALDRGHDPTA